MVQKSLQLNLIAKLMSGEVVSRHGCVVVVKEGGGGGGADTAGSWSPIDCCVVGVKEGGGGRADTAGSWSPIDAHVQLESDISCLWHGCCRLGAAVTLHCVVGWWQPWSTDSQIYHVVWRRISSYVLDVVPSRSARTPTTHDCVQWVGPLSVPLLSVESPVDCWTKRRPGLRLIYHWPFFTG